MARRVPLGFEPASATIVPGCAASGATAGETSGGTSGETVCLGSRLETDKGYVVTGRVLITGGCGFIGRRLAAELLANGYDVRILDSLVEQVHGPAGSSPLTEVEVVVGDVRSRETVDRAISGVDHVVHLAAEVGVGQSMYEIARYVGANDLGTAVLLEALLERPPERIVVASSMSVYGEGAYVDSDGRRHEQVRRRRSDVSQGRWDPLGPEHRPLRAVPTDERKPVDLASIYALTKYAQERQVLIFGEAYGVEATALRLFNVFGPGQALSNPYTGVLANFASRIASGQRPLVFEDGEQKRDFVHVDDVARAFRLALESPNVGGEVINVGSGNAYSIRWVAEELAAVMGAPQLAPDILGKSRSGDIRNCFADITKARELLAFSPRRSLEDSFEEIADWVAGSEATDNAQRMRRELEVRGLVA
ncbi:MAG: NAD-dependent epimerase/dehydratase family protein [Rhizobiaceae bacterium]|nr:NAD-dependent epimerase/dehydratase family protein [Rhizobiaceae bacterium]MCV0407476.1 NAD-dependent epimerase/dehydratase family protein [Rhizobiaceae bacterium]